MLCLPRWPGWSVLLACCAIGVLVAAWRRSWWPVAVAVSIAGTSWTLSAALANRLDPALEGQSLSLRGTVVSVPQGTLESLRFRFAPDDGDAGSSTAPKLPRIVELTWYDAPGRVLPAERLDLEVKLRRPRGFANPGGFDNEARMLRERIGASGYVRFGTRLGRAHDAAWRHPVLLARGRVDAIVRDVLGTRPAAGIVAGLSVGLQDALSREQWLTLARSGTTHLMAISGLHIAMVGAVAAWLGARVQRWRQRLGALAAQRDAAVVAGALAALAYSLLAGWSVPTQRTMVMIALGSVALALRRRVGIADGLGACVLAVLVADPLAPLSTGFWLSFGAVATILFAATGFAHPPSPTASYLRVQAVVTVGLVPMLVGSFGAVSLVAALVNLYAVPLYTLIVVPAVLLSCAVALASIDLGAPLLHATASLIEVTWPLLAVPAGWPLATWSIAGLDAVAWCALLAGAAAALAPLPAAGRLAGIVLVTAACLSRPPPLSPGEASVTVLDVGQGLSVVVETRGHVLLYDTGPSFRSGSDTGQLVVLPYLRHRGVRALDVLAVSHDDDDHAGGTASVLAMLPVRRLVRGPSIAADRLVVSGATRPARCRRGDRWQWDGVQFEWLHPGPEAYARDNDGSCVLRVRAGDRTALVTGDVEAQAEADLLATTALAPVDVLVAPHHGSRTSSTAPFVAACRPAWVVYAVGHRNRWGFPYAGVVERYDAVGARGLRTSSSGALTFRLRPGRPVEPPQQWRRESLRTWRDS
ncbi:MAG TPA: DNA internalization-related competence protein ComEC/Rec2 [Steroidobacteraceae bacterium]|nr:DNA internalization-related competence protein ComEC/Rec2 [Steroidobacteraceae bacterium]